jgi:hypothetical protein
MADQPKGVSADTVIAELLAIANRENLALQERIAAAEARIDRFKGDLEELAARHSWPPPKIDQFTGHLELRLETALAGGKLDTGHAAIFQRALKRL